jgi:hypothetical protein
MNYPTDITDSIILAKLNKLIEFISINLTIPNYEQQAIIDIVDGIFISNSISKMTNDKIELYVLDSVDGRALTLGIKGLIHGNINKSPNAVEYNYKLGKLVGYIIAIVSINLTP